MIQFITPLGLNPDTFRQMCCHPTHILSVVLIQLTPFLAGCQERGAAPASLPYYHVAFSSDGKWLAAGGGWPKTRNAFRKGGDGFIKVWETTKWTTRISCADEKFTDWLAWLNFSDDGNVIAASNHILPTGPEIVAGTQLRFWDVRKNTELPSVQIKEMTGMARGGCAFSPARNLLAYDIYHDVENKTVGIFTFPECKRKAVLKGHPGVSNFLAFSSDGKPIGSYVASKSLILVYDVDTGKRLAERRFVQQDAAAMSYLSGSFHK